MKGNYTEPIPDYGDVMTVEDWKAAVRSGSFNDYDGGGKAAKDGKVDKCWIYPSEADASIPEDATHIVWFNK